MKKYSIEEVKCKLPEFVKIIESTYKNMRSKCSFYDIDYKEFFESSPYTVIYNKMGCPQRQQQKTLDKYGKLFAHSIKIEEFKKRLPTYIQVIDETFEGMHKKCKFIDTEYNEEFECAPANLSKTNCRSRGKKNFADKEKLKEDEINKRLERVYGEGFCKIIYSTYKNVDSSAKFDIINRGIVTYIPALVFQGYLTSNRGKYKVFRAESLILYNNRCVISGETKKIHVHHIYNKKDYPELIFNKYNGVPLTEQIHLLFHNIYGRNVTPNEFLEFISKYNLDENIIQFIKENISKIYGSPILNC